MTRGTVYLIDDEPELLALLCELAEMAGLDAQGYTQGSDFFEAVTVFDPCSIIVLDLHMPEMDGIEVMRRLVRMPNPPSLILLSGADNGVLHAAEMLGRAHNLEILASLSKPVATAQFIQLLKQHTREDNDSRRENPAHSRQDITVDDLLLALHNDHLVLHYQPQVDMRTDKLIGVEALMRWLHPEYGLLSPDSFIPFAEQNGLIGELTHWLIEEAMRQAQQWQDTGLRLVVSVNVSAADITDLDLPEHISELLKDNKLDPTQITLELTESELMGELVTSLDILTRLRLKGIGLSIDDFGTGYSSLVQLHQVPFNELKIDSSFVANMFNDDEARAIVKTCILLGHDLDMKVVAEGVEDQRSWDFLVSQGCDVAQGYFIAKPMPGNDLIEWVANWELKPRERKHLAIQTH